MLKKNKQQKDPNSVFEALSRSADFTNELSRNGDFLYRISFFRSLINGHLLHEQILPSLKQLHLSPTLEELKERIPIEKAVITSDLQTVQEALHRAALRLDLRQTGAKRFSCRLKKRKADK
ncbi:hypothetical protein FX981_03494 [Bacillus safensis]|uniref:Uncharacterized protein n=1 Tax=Bacillus safensis TaxID=561879 RepID=A0A5C0WMC7_BACIA|nr:hypothetical protein [Bacillus safensis]QEK65224.1 hypothetical protein FX981_03494 [Bacillus safensis]